MFTLPKTTADGLADSVVVVATPVPLTATVDGEFEAFVVKLTMPLVLPAAIGANCTLKVLFCPAAIVNGVVTPVTLTPAPVELNCEIVRLAVPVLVTVTVCDLAWPSTKLPKLMLGGATLIPGSTPGIYGDMLER